MNKNTLSNLPKNCINERVSRTLRVRAGTIDRADYRHECPRTPQWATDHGLRTAALELIHSAGLSCVNADVIYVSIEKKMFPIKKKKSLSIRS